MTQTTGRVFDELAKLMTDAAGAAQGVRKEVEGLMRSQGERILKEMDVVDRDAFEAVKAMAEKARAGSFLPDPNSSQLFRSISQPSFPCRPC